MPCSPGVIVQGPHLRDIILGEKKAREFLEQLRACARTRAFFRGEKMEKITRKPRRESMRLTTCVGSF
jgi:hypothetical protein